MVDFLDELRNALKRATPDCLIGNQRKESFHLVEPGTVSRDEMHVPAWPARQPGFDAGMLMRRVVVDDDVDVEFGRDGLVDGPQEAQKFLMAMPRLAFCQYRAIEHIECSKQGRGAMPFVIVRTPST